MNPPSSHPQPPAPPASPAQPPRFEEALGELQQIVGRLNQAELPLDEALALYDRGVRLAAHGRELLKRAEQRVAQSRGDGGGDESGA